MAKLIVAHPAIRTGASLVDLPERALAQTIARMTTPFVIIIDAIALPLNDHLSTTQRCTQPNGPRCPTDGPGTARWRGPHTGTHAYS